MPRAEYDALDRANYSRIKAFARSPRHFQIVQREETDALRFGIALHLAVFEPARYKSEVVSWEGTRRGEKWQAFTREHAGHVILTAEQHQRVSVCAACVATDAEVMPYLAGGRAEVTALWTDAATGVECKARLDWIASIGAVVDLKSTRDASPEAFARQAWNLHYHAQAAMYSDAIHAITGERLPSVIVAVESEQPHNVVVYDVPQEGIDAGRKAYRGWLAQLAECREKNEWPGYASGRQVLLPPKWADTSGEPEEENTDE